MKTITAMQRLQGIQTQQLVLNSAIPVVTVPIHANRQLTLLTECVIRQHLLSTTKVLT